MWIQLDKYNGTVWVDTRKFVSLEPIKDDPVKTIIGMDNKDYWYVYNTVEEIFEKMEMSDKVEILGDGSLANLNITSGHSSILKFDDPDAV